MMMMIAVADDIRTKCNSIWTAKKAFSITFHSSSIFGSGQFWLYNIE